MDSYNFLYKGAELICQEVGTTDIEIQCVWFNYTLRNMKGIFIIVDEFPNMYEITYNSNRNEIYIDKYTKNYNKVIKV